MCATLSSPYSSRSKEILSLLGIRDAESVVALQTLVDAFEVDPPIVVAEVVAASTPGPSLGGWWQGPSFDAPASQASY